MKDYVGNGCKTKRDVGLTEGEKEREREGGGGGRRGIKLM